MYVHFDALSMRIKNRMNRMQLSVQIQGNDSMKTPLYGRSEKALPCSGVFYDIIFRALRQACT